MDFQQSPHLLPPQNGSSVILVTWKIHHWLERVVIEPVPDTGIGRAIIDRRGCLSCANKGFSLRSDVTTLKGCMMKSVGLREINQAFSRYMKIVKSGEDVLITERGRPIAVIKPLPCKMDMSWHQARSSTSTTCGCATRAWPSSLDSRALR